MATIYCMNCGAPLDEHAKFCTECGCLTRLGASVMQTREMSPLPTDVAEDGPEPEVASGAEAAPPAETAGAGHSLPREGSAPAGAQVYAPAPASAHRAHAHASHARAERSSLTPVVVGVAAAVLALVVIMSSCLASGVLGGVGGNPSAGSGESEAASNDGGAQMGSAGTEIRSSLSAYSWAELSIIAKEMSRAGSRDAALSLAREYGLVDSSGNMTRDTKTVEVAGMGTLTMRLVDVYHDTLADGGSAGLTFLASDLSLMHRMRETDENVGGWEASELRGWLNGEVLDALPEELGSVIVAVDKLSDNVGRSTNVSSVTSTLDKLWIPSVVELTGPISWAWDSDLSNSDAYNDIMNAEGSQYALFEELDILEADPNPSLMLDHGGATVPWWLRSVSPSKDNHYRIVDADGDPSRFGSAPDGLGVCVGFCL